MRPNLHNVPFVQPPHFTTPIFIKLFLYNPLFVQPPFCTTLLCTAPLLATLDGGTYGEQEQDEQVTVKGDSTNCPMDGGAYEKQKQEGQVTVNGDSVTTCPLRGGEN